MNNKLRFDGVFSGHQGDVQIFSIEALPANATSVPKKFIAKSEKSGHAHALCGDYDQYELPNDTGFIVKVGVKGATLNHTQYHNLTEGYWGENKALPVADHKPTVLGQGTYFIGIQKRKKHFSKVFEKVVD